MPDYQDQEEQQFARLRKALIDHGDNNGVRVEFGQFFGVVRPLIPYHKNLIHWPYRDQSMAIPDNLDLLGHVELVRPFH